jgi:pentose-5-phosphate-3-epimerase
MPRAIISPSVLASDFGQLTAECKRMIKGGAEWLHMGEHIHIDLFFAQLQLNPEPT